MRLSPIALAVLAGAVLSAAFAGRAGAADVVVRIEGAETASGSFAVRLCDEAGWGGGPCAVRRFPAALEPEPIVFEDVAPGAYAVGVVHDENGNDELDMRWYGAPKEPYGASNNPPLRRGPDLWDDAAFDVEEGARVDLVVTLRRWGAG